MSDNTLQTPKTHTWIIVLLVWVIALLVFVAGYMIYRDQTDTVNVATEGDDASCSEEIADAIKAYQDGKSDDAAAECPEGSGIVDSTASHPGFIYPESWHVFGSARILDSAQYTVYASANPVFLCDGCDMRASDVVMTIADKTTIIAKNTLPTYTEAYLLEIETDPGYSDVQKTSTATSNGLKTVISGKLTDNNLGGPGTFEIVLFEGTDTMVLVNFMDAETFPGDKEGWEIVKASLDFSKIK